MAAQYRGKFGFLVPGAGLVATGQLQTSGSTAQGATSIVLTAGTTLTGTINYGDTFVISATTYTCLASATASSNLVTVQVSPAVPSTISTGTSATSYTVNNYAQDVPTGGAMLAPPTSSGWGIGNTSLLGVTCCITSLVTGSQVELWLFDPSASDPTLISNYKLGQVLLTAVGSTTVALASYPAAALRCKADGTHAGTTTIFFSAD